MSKPPQNLKNHGRLDPPYHFIFLAVVTANLFIVLCYTWSHLNLYSEWLTLLSIAAFIIAGGILGATVSGKLLGRFGAGLQARAPWLLALGLFLSLWEVATAKFA